MGKELSIVITTYNRKEPLLEQLRSIEKQGLYDKYEVIISDNHSNYDVKEWVETSLSSDFLKNVSVVQRPMNIGGSLNITLSFQLAKTKWMWLLSDDDITEPNSIKTILDDIERHKNDDVCCVKYSISGRFAKNDDKIIDNVVDFFDYYTGTHTAGEMVFMCNNLFNMEHLRKFFIDIAMNANTCMPQVLLPLLAVKNANKKIRLSPVSLTNYVAGRISYDLVRVYLSFGNMLYVKPLSMNAKEISSFKRIRFFGDKELIKVFADIKDKKLRWEMFKKIFVAHYNLFSLRALKLFLYYPLYPWVIRYRSKH